MATKKMRKVRKSRKMRKTRSKRKTQFRRKNRGGYGIQPQLNTDYRFVVNLRPNDKYHHYV